MYFSGFIYLIVFCTTALLARSCPFDSLSLGLLNRTIYKKNLDIGLAVVSFFFESGIIFRVQTWFLPMVLNGVSCLHILPFFSWFFSFNFKEIQQTIYTIYMYPCYYCIVHTRALHSPLQWFTSQRETVTLSLGFSFFCTLYMLMGFIC
ncbi:hypothetical protein OIU77_014436 [Salix suchowensis]|uniref:Uncharacterized protein n=1 Tax=Salix suchowensis TaxID=1278906 RepID=A0ABQ8ZX96_9ROSI|nr:hypothetical protein OIU77_014436 [Salix suchowensis]